MWAMSFTVYAESMKYTFCNVFVHGLGALFHVILVWLLVGVFSFGWEGILIATSVHFVIRYFFALIYVNAFVQPYKDSNEVKFFQEETFTNLWPQASRGIGSLFMGCWSWWAFDIFTLICSYLSMEIIEAQTILRTLGMLTFMIPVGFSKGCGFFIGKSIGEGSEAAIKHIYNASMNLSIFVGFV